MVKFIFSENQFQSSKQLQKGQKSAFIELCAYYYFPFFGVCKLVWSFEKSCLLVALNKLLETALV